MSIAAHIAGTQPVVMRQTAAAVILIACDPVLEIFEENQDILEDNQNLPASILSAKQVAPIEKENRRCPGPDRPISLPRWLSYLSS